jgi:class 3 adenylate cyclase
VEPIVTLPLPRNPQLAEFARLFNEAGYWAIVSDASWRIVYLTDELRLALGDEGAEPFVSMGTNLFSVEARRDYLMAVMLDEERALEFQRRFFGAHGPYALFGTPGGKDELAQMIDPELRPLLDDMEPIEPPLAVYSGRGHHAYEGTDVGSVLTEFRVDGPDGRFVGTVRLIKPAPGMSQLAASTATADPRHLERMRQVARPDRRPAAILIADLEASSPLSKQLPTAQFFSFGRRLVRAADQSIIDEGGIVGRHAGDGVVGFFLVDHLGSDSAAARASIEASRSLRRALDGVMDRSMLADADVTLRFGLHWGSTIYVGSIQTSGRSEVTALGDEVNEAARIEACATGGRTLASKDLVERLSQDDATALGLDVTQVRYALLADLASATDKARRDAPAVAVCEIEDDTR